MSKRFVSIWFRHLKTDWFARRQTELKDRAFVLAAPDHGRMVIKAVNSIAAAKGIYTGMVVADARAIISSLEIMDDRPELSKKLLTGIAEWCIRFTPVAAIDEPAGIILDATGCTHLWGDENRYLTEIYKRISGFGYDTHISIADTIGTAWATARFGQEVLTITETGRQMNALLNLPAIALRIDAAIAERLEKLGIGQVSSFINMPRPSLRRRFGQQLLERIDQALGKEQEWINPVQPVEPYHERLPCVEPIITATGIEIALQRLLDTVCDRLQREQKGLRMASFKAYRMDGKIEKLEIGTNRPSCNSKHLFKLFEIKIDTIEPALGIELFTLDALKIEDHSAMQEKLWESDGIDNIELSELLDRVAGKIGTCTINRYVPDEHYWPERSFKAAQSINEQLQTAWKVDHPRPLQLLSIPQPIEVTAPIPDYPPMNFRYKGKLHKIIKADGPERIEQEWWLQDGQHRDYYYVEDEEGCRYWVFRSGHYDVGRNYRWFVHGFFA